MPPKVQMIGKRFGRLLVISEGDKGSGSSIRYICKCDCGTITKPIDGMSLRKGLTKSCGCFRREVAFEKLPLAHEGARKHGLGGTHIYHWSDPRALTNRERARLQTFPDTYVFEGSKEGVRKQIGMAVPCKGAKIIFEAILKSFAGIEYPYTEANINE